jgi:hypothetical protein
MEVSAENSLPQVHSQKTSPCTAAACVPVPATTGLGWPARGRTQVSPLTTWRDGQGCVIYTWRMPEATKYLWSVLEVPSPTVISPSS